MLYYLFEYLDKDFDFPGAGLFQYISFRAACSIILSLTISLVFGKRLINILKRRQVGETVRDLGLQDKLKKLEHQRWVDLIILAAILIPTLLFARLTNIYVLTMLVATVWLRHRWIHG
jgi:phospho-N-acetylmuramoyl-pentapeptide-transferase